MTEPRTLPGLGQLTLEDRYWIRSIGCLGFGLPVVRLYWPANDPRPNASRLAEAMIARQRARLENRA